MILHELLPLLDHVVLDLLVLEVPDKVLGLDVPDLGVFLLPSCQELASQRLLFPE